MQTTDSDDNSQAHGSATNNPAADDAPRGEREPLVDRLAQGAHAAIDRLAEKAAPAVGSFSAKADQFSTMEEEWLRTARTCVRDHPIASITLAVAAGMMLGRMAR